jgi:electron transfer flavoprotein beta subunit
MGAKKKPLDVLTLADLGVDAADVGDAGSMTEVLGVGEPPARLNTLSVEDDGNAAQAILDFLVDQQLA